MKRFLLAVFFAFSVIARAADLVPSAYLVPWTPGTTVGVVGGIPTGRTVVNITGLDNTGATDVTAALQGWIDGASSGQDLRLPAGTFRLDSQINITVDNITLSGTVSGSTLQTTLDSRAGYAIRIGSANGVAIPPGASTADVTITAGLTKDNDNITIGDTSFFAAGDLIMINVVDNDTDIPVVSTGAARGLVNQMARVVSVDSATDMTIFPPLYSDYGAGTLDVIIYKGDNTRLSGVQNFILELDNYVGTGNTGVHIANAIDCWAYNVRINNCVSYPTYFANALNCEIRRLYIGPRKGGLLTSNGGGWLCNYTSASLFIDTVIIDNGPLIEINAGSSGNLITRNYMTGSFANFNHAPWNRFNLAIWNAIDAFLVDGYFGGASEQHFIANLTDTVALKRFSYYHTFAANLVSQNPSQMVFGEPNIGNSSFSGTANYPSDPWVDYGMNGTLTTIVKGTGAGYLVNNVGGYTAGATTIAVDTGTGTILTGDVVTFTGDSNRYLVTSGLSGGSITIGNNQNGALGLQQSLADNTAVAITSDTALVTLTSPYTLPIYSSGDRALRYLIWNNYASEVRYRDDTQTTGVLRVLADSATQPNTVALPATSTAMIIGAGNTGFQEYDLRVSATLIKAANRYGDGTYEGLGGATLNSVFVENAKPQWVLDQETEFGTTFAINPYNATLYTSGSPSDIPAGYRALFLTAPEVQSISINSAGTQLALTANKNLVVGAGGSGGFSVGGDVVLTYNSISGSIVIFDLSRVVNSGETFTLTYVNPGSGIEDSNGNDLASFSGLPVSNFSQQGAGATWVMSINSEDAPIESAMSEAGAIRQPIVITQSGFATGIRVAIGDLVGTQLSKVALLDTDGSTVMVSASEVVEVADDYTVYAINSTQLSAGTYTVAIATNGTAGFYLKYANAPANSSSFGFISSYASWPGSSVPNDGSLSRTYSMGIQMIYDNTSQATVSGTTTVTGTLTLP